MKKLNVLLAAVLLGALSATTFISCSNGEDGKDGVGIVWKGQLATAPANPDYNWAYYNTTDKCSYLWDGSKWTVLAGPSAQTEFSVSVVGSDTFITKEVNFRRVDDSTKQPYTLGEPITFAFANDMPEVPYVLCTDALIKDLTGRTYTVSAVTKDSKSVTVTNSVTSATLTLDLTRHTCTYSNYDAFFLTSKDASFVDVAYPLNDYIKIVDLHNTPGQSITLDWSTQDIGVVIYNNGNTCSLAIPLQFFNTVFGQNFVYNGSNIYYPDDLLQRGTDADGYKALQEEYYSVGSKTETSQKFADYRYNDFCLNLDINYGLKSQHGIDKFPDFDTYFTVIGLKNKLKSTNPLTFAQAVRDVCEYYFGDGHSNYEKISYLIGSTASISTALLSQNDKNYAINTTLYKTARNKGKETVTENGQARAKIPGYELSSDKKTIIVRFDSFENNNSKREARINERAKLRESNDLILKDYVGVNESEYDTVSFISAINEIIRENTEIENVVLDLSCNGGGAVHTAAVVVAWMLGEATFNMENPITGAKWSITYTADINMDGTYDGNTTPNTGITGDSIKDKNLFCLISPLSFSCGNTTPALLAASDRVTILGTKSGGGTAFVHHASAADGTLYRMSSKYVTGTSKNGATYDIDQGVEPHVRISKPANFYNVEKINTLVTSLN